MESIRDAQLAVHGWTWRLWSHKLVPVQVLFFQRFTYVFNEFWLFFSSLIASLSPPRSFPIDCLPTIHDWSLLSLLWWSTEKSECLDEHELGLIYWSMPTYQRLYHWRKWHPPPETSDFLREGWGLMSPPSTCDGLLTDLSHADIVQLTTPVVGLWVCWHVISGRHLCPARLFPFWLLHPSTSLSMTLEGLM